MALKGHIPWNKGKTGVQTHSAETRQKISENNAKHWLGKTRTDMLGHPKWNFTDWDHKAVAPKGADNPMWKGDKVGYHALHTWVARKLGKPLECDECGFTSDNTLQFDWANISHEYKRDLDDWARLCKKCHSAYDNNKLVLTNKEKYYGRSYASV